jgi:hypothetical protein
MARGQRQGAQADSVPASMPSSLPTMNGDHSFTLQAVMQMHKSMGSLEASIKNLSDAVDRQRASTDEVKKKLGNIEKVMYAAGVVLIIAVTAGGWIMNTTKDFALLAYKASIEVQKPAQEPPRPPAQKP